MNGQDNLIPLNKRTKDEVREIARKGGINSGKTRKAKKNTAELVNLMLNSALSAENKKKVTKIAKIDSEDMTVNALMTAGMIKSAICGNPKAFEILQTWNDKSIKKNEEKTIFNMPITDVTIDFVEVYRQVHKIFEGKSKVREIICKGGRGSVKSNFWSAVAEETIYNDPKAHIVFTRRYKTDLRGSVYNQFIKTVRRHDKLDEWEFTTSPMIAKYKKTGQCVLFVGADKPISLKSYNLSFGYVKMLIHEECDEMAGIEQMDNIEDTFLRADTQAVDVKIFNPPKSANNFMNEYTESKKEDSETYICQSYYYNVPIEWLGKRFFDRAEWFKINKPLYYKNNYLGEVTGTGGNVFENVEVRTITEEEIDTFDNFCYGLDFGYEHAQAFIKSYYDSETDILYCIEEVYAKKCKNSTFSRKISQYKNVEIIADSARPDSIAEMRDWGFEIIGAKKRWGANKGRDYCWEWLQQCHKIVVDENRTPHLAEELKKLEFEQLKDGTFSSKYPDLNEDCVMALIYGLNRIIMLSRRDDLYLDEELEDENEEI